MQFFIVLSLVAAACADVSHLVHKGGPDADAVILKQDVDVAPESYAFNYETSNGIAAQESGQVKNAGSENAAIVASGQFSYSAPDGSPIAVSYVADENGFQPQGAHLPTPPPPQPIPDYILRSLDWIAAHPQKEEQQFNRQVVASASAFAKKY